MKLQEEEFFAISMNLMGEAYPIRFHTKNYHDALNIAQLFCGRNPEKHLFIVSYDYTELAYSRYLKYKKSKTRNNKN